jgi:superfamily II DNA/RNA helicase
VLERSREVPEVSNSGAESSGSGAEEKRASSELVDDRMSAWYGMGILSPILRALAEQGFVEPTEIQVRIRK